MCKVTGLLRDTRSQTPEPSATLTVLHTCTEVIPLAHRNGVSEYAQKTRGKLTTNWQHTPI